MRKKHYGFDKPSKHIHISVDGAVRYNAILFIPEKIPFDYYTKEYEKGIRAIFQWRTDYEQMCGPPS
ncbi:hypothetical protein GCM10020331_069700 [Ectobacillus funiculus]